MTPKTLTTTEAAGKEPEIVTPSPDSNGLPFFGIFVQQFTFWLLSLIHLIGKKSYLSVAIFLSSVAVHLYAQDIRSYGAFAGLNFPLTLDQGLLKDPRFFSKFTARGTPFGFLYAYDKVGYGYMIMPQYMQVGQTYLIQNTIGGEVGKREIRMNYVSLSAALKIHLADLAAARVSIVAAVTPSFLIKGEELITHSAAKLRYPPIVAIPADPGYIPAFDGVFVPAVSEQVQVSGDKFNAFNLFAGIGIFSEFSFSENWSVNLEGRANFGIFETRNTAYLDRLQAADPPDIYGQRREVFLSVTFGIAHTLTLKNSFKPRPMGHKKSSYKSIPYRKLSKPN